MGPALGCIRRGRAAAVVSCVHRRTSGRWCAPTRGTRRRGRWSIPTGGGTGSRAGRRTWSWSGPSTGASSALEAEGVDVVQIQDRRPAPYPPDVYPGSAVTVPGGAIIGRMAPAMSRGEEPRDEAVAELGCRSCGRSRGGPDRGRKPDQAAPGLAAYGTSIRCNPEGAAQLREVLNVLGIELMVVPMAGWSIHLDGHIGMVSPTRPWWRQRTAVLVPRSAPGAGIEAIPCPAGEEWAINSLAVDPAAC